MQTSSYLLSVTYSHLLIGWRRILGSSAHGSQDNLVHTKVFVVETTPKNFELLKKLSKQSVLGLTIYTSLCWTLVTITSLSREFVLPSYPKPHFLGATMYGSLPFFPSSLLLWVWPHSVFLHTSGLTSCNNSTLTWKTWMLFRMCWRENMHEDLLCWKILCCFEWLYLFLHSKICSVVLMFKTEIIVLFGCMMIKLFGFRCLIVIIKFNYECLLVCLVVARVRALQNTCIQYKHNISSTKQSIVHILPLTHSEWHSNMPVGCRAATWDQSTCVRENRVRSNSK